MYDKNTLEYLNIRLLIGFYIDLNIILALNPYPQWTGLCVACILFS
jgi:hypothetical protein